MKNKSGILIHKAGFVDQKQFESEYQSVKFLSGIFAFELVSNHVFTRYEY